MEMFFFLVIELVYNKCYNKVEGDNMEYNISKDVNIIRILLDLSQEELANIIGVEKISISRLETGKSDLSERKIKELYNYIYSKKIYLNKLKSAMYKEMLNNNIIYNKTQD